MTNTQGSYIRIAGWGPVMHGGTLRSRQLIDLATIGLPGIEVRNPARPGISAWREAIAALPNVLQAMPKTTFPVRQRLAGAWIAQQLALQGHKPTKPILYDADQIFGEAMLTAAEICRSPLIAHTHNLEPHYQFFRKGKDPIGRFTRDLDRELRWLSRCKMVWSIGLLEHRVFSLCGVNSRMLPYYPSKSRLAELMEIRQARSTCPVEDFVLVMGTTHNEPTLTGMVQQLKFAAQENFQKKIIVVGAGTERLREFASDKIEIRGGLEWHELARILTRARVLWAHQAEMTGALTRVTETLLMGIPVVANDWAAIGLRSMDGLTVYEDIGDAPELLENASADFLPPVRPIEEEQYVRFLRTEFS